jgi:hypothetical protein
MLDFVAFHHRCPRQYLLQQQPEFRDVPLAVAQRVNRDALDFLPFDPEGQVERSAGGDDAQILIEDQQRLANRIDDRQGKRSCVVDTREEVNVSDGKPYANDANDRPGIRKTARLRRRCAPVTA